MGYTVQLVATTVIVVGDDGIMEFVFPPPPPSGLRRPSRACQDVGGRLRRPAEEVRRLPALGRRRGRRRRPGRGGEDQEEAQGARSSRLFHCMHLANTAFPSFRAERPPWSPSSGATSSTSSPAAGGPTSTSSSTRVRTGGHRHLALSYLCYIVTAVLSTTCSGIVLDGIEYPESTLLPPSPSLPSPSSSSPSSSSSFLGVPVPVPARVHHYLSTTYGPDWRTRCASRRRDHRRERPADGAGAEAACGRLGAMFEIYRRRRRRGDGRGGDMVTSNADLNATL